MPFFDDSGPRPEEERHPLWRAFAHLGDRLEQMLALNLFWSLQTIPALLAWAFPDWPLGVRLLLLFYTALALLPASALLLHVLSDLTRGHPLDLADLRRLLLPCLVGAFTRLLPLVTLISLLLGLLTWADAHGWLPLGVLARLALFWVGVLSVHWGSGYLDGHSAWGILRQSVRRFWQRPGQTLGLALASALAITLGVVSIGGFFLIVPVLLALIQIEAGRSFSSRLAA